jgi:hypothetical protein
MVGADVALGFVVVANPKRYFPHDDDSTLSSGFNLRLFFDGGRQPKRVADAVRTAADALADEDDERAAEDVTEAFPSPCERQVPRHVETGERMVACHRFDPDAPGETEW